MLRSNAVWLSVIVVLALVLGGAGAARGDNLLGNASLEIDSGSDGLPDQWQRTPAAAIAYREDDAANAHSGQDYIEIGPGPDGWAVMWAEPDIPVTPATQYTMGVYAVEADGAGRGRPVSGLLGLKVEWYANRGDPYDSRLDTDILGLTVSRTGEYVYYEGSVVNDSGARYARIGIQATEVRGESGTFRIDDLFFTRTFPLAKPDYNQDRVVNWTDFAYFAEGWREGLPAYDMDGDGAFRGNDLSMFFREWMRIIPEKEGYQFVWSDEFDGVELDYANWTHEVGNAWYNNELQSYTARKENAEVSGGKLSIVARAEELWGNDFTSARIRSKGKRDFLYGRMEARIKLPRGQGLWPAFWMMPSDAAYGGWPHSGEIDIMEAINQMDFVSGALHFSSTSGQHKYVSQRYVDKETDWSDDFHVYAIEWEPEEIRWYVDQIHYFSETHWSSLRNRYPAPFEHPFHFILNVAVGGDWPGAPDRTTVFPQTMQVDWVRVYQKTLPRDHTGGISGPNATSVTGHDSDS